MMNFVRSWMIRALTLVLLVSISAWGATVTVSPSTVPIGAYLNGGDGDQYFMQSLKFYMDVDAAWSDGDNIVITLPTGMTIADVSDGGTYVDEINLSENAVTDPNWTLAATSSTITLTATTGANVKDQTAVTVIFPIITSSGLTDGSTADYSFAIGATGDEESSFSTVTVTYEADQLALATFTTAFTGGDSSSTKGEAYPSSNYYTQSTDALTSSLPDLIPENNAVVELLDETAFTTHVNWDVTGDIDDSGGNATYTWSANQANTLTQVNADQANNALPGQYYTLAYTVTVTAATDGTFTMTIPTPFAATTTSLEITAGTHYVTFLTSSTADAEDFVINITSAGATQGTYVLDDLQFVRAGDVTNSVSDWDGITLDNDNNAAGGNAVADAEALYYFWASQTSGLKRIDSQSGHKPVMSNNTDPDNITLQEFGDGGTAGYVEEGADFGTCLIDATQLAEGNWYFYVTSSVTSDWVLGASDVVKIKHYPTFTIGADGSTPETGGGLDVDADGIWEPGDGTNDDTEDYYLDSGNLLSVAGALLLDASGVDNVDFYYALDDVDDNADVDIFLSTTDALTTSSITISGSTGSEVVTGLTGATKITSTSLKEDSLTSYYNYDIYTDASTYETAGDFYIYFVANDGTTQTLLQAVDGTADADMQIHVKHLPAFTFQDHYGTGAAANAVATESEPYFTINWGETIDGDKDADDNQRIRIYASQHDLTADAALIGYSTTLTSVDSTLLPALVTSAPTAHALILDRRDTGDTRLDNRYMWDVKNSGLAAGTYYLYALCTDGTDAVIYQAQSAGDDDQTITLTHGAFFQPINPVEDQIVELDKESTFELRWEAYDKDATSTDFIVAAFILPSGTSVVTTSTSAADVDGDANNSDAFWLTSTDGDDVETGNYAGDKKYTVDVSAIIQDMAGNAQTPSGLYDVYYFYDTDGDFTGDDETMVQADGQLYFTDTGNASAAENFKMSPKISVLSKGDTVSVDIYVLDAGPDPEFVSVYLDVDDNTYLTVVDQDSNTSGTQPFSGESVNYNGTILENKYTDTGSGFQLDYVEWATGGDALAASLKVATVQFVVSTTAPSNILQNTTITFSTSGTRSSALLSADGTEQDVTFDDDGAVVGVAAGGKISGFVDLEGRTEQTQTVTMYVCPLGSYDCISDADFLTANDNNADATDGIEVTLGAGGSYELTQIPAGKYDIIVHKDGYLDQRIAAQTVYNLSTTNIDIDKTNEMLAGDCAGYDHDGSSSTLEQPDNQINTDDTDAMNTAYGTSSGDGAWNAYADVNGDGIVNVTDFNYAATNGVATSGEGIVYKGYMGTNENAQARLIDLGNNRYSVLLNNITNVHAYDIELKFNKDEYKLVSYHDGLSEKLSSTSFIKESGFTNNFVSAIMGRDIIRSSELTALTFELEALVVQPGTKPELVQVALVDGNNSMAKAIIETESASMPSEFKLERNYPNPFNPVTTIGFALPDAANVKLVVYNVVGQEIRTLVNNTMEAGSYNAIWNSMDNNGKRVSSGVYFYRLLVDGKMISTQKMVLMK